MVRMDTETLTQAINKAVGDELRGLRGKRKISREEMRRQTGLGISTIQRFENGERSPELQQLVQILDVLNIGLKEFIENAMKDIEW